jgi:hypothetical protein
MATRMLRVTVDDKKVVDHLELHARNVTAAMAAAAQETAEAIETKGREDISQAGNFGPAWTFGFKSTTSETSDGVQVVTTMSGKRHGWRIFQEGKTIAGKPLLWIPLSGTDAKGIPARKYPGGVVQNASRAGTLLLISKRDHRPKYHGMTSVTIPKKFHLIEIATEEGNKLSERFSKNFKKMSNNNG